MALGRKTGGRQKGTQNKIGTTLKDMILGAVDTIGGEEYLVKQSKENPTAFMTLIGKVLPLQVQGDAENPLATVLSIKLVGPED